MAEPQWSEDSFKRKEERKWDTPRSQGGMKCDGYEPYPRMLYKAMANPLSGKHEVHMQRDIISADRTVVLLNAEQFNASCQLIVKSENEHNKAKDDGWRDSPHEAIAYHKRFEDEMAKAAAERNYADRNMGDKAKAEAASVESSTAEHVPEIPENRKRKAS